MVDDFNGLDDMNMQWYAYALQSVLFILYLSGLCGGIFLLHINSVIYQKHGA